MSKQRIAGIDSLRGLMILLMVMTHFVHDLTLFGWFPAEIYYAQPIQALIALGAGVFILLSGAMAPFSRSNLRRGIRYLIAGLAVTAATLLFPQNGVVWFGILQLLGISALFYAGFGAHLERLSSQMRSVLYGLGLFFAAVLTAVPVTFPGAWILGFTAGAPAMADFFPILPWIFVYLLGTLWGNALRSGKYPAWFGSWNSPILHFSSRHAILIYLLHQPILLGILRLAQSIIA